MVYLYLFFNLVDDDDDNDDDGLRIVHLHPTSALCFASANLPAHAPTVVFRDLVHAQGKLYLRGVTSVSSKSYRDQYRRAYVPVPVHQLSQQEAPPSPASTAPTAASANASAVGDGASGSLGESQSSAPSKKRAFDEVEGVSASGTVAAVGSSANAQVDDARARYLARRKK